MIDLKGKALNEDFYESTLGMFKGVAAVKKGEKWFFIDKAGRELTPERFDEVSSFSFDDLALVRQGHEWFYLDRRTGGQPVGPERYLTATIPDLKGEVTVTTRAGVLKRLHVRSGKVLWSFY